MTPIPVHFAIDLEPDERLPGAHSQSFDSAGVALREIAARRAEFEDKTGARVSFGWYVRMDRHIAAVYGDACAIVEHYHQQLDARAREGDDIGLHIHSIERKKDGGWRANYADAALVDDTIEEAAAHFTEFFGRPCRSARMGDMWTGDHCMEKLASLGVRYDVTPESGLRPQAVAALYPGTDSIGARPSMLATPLAPFQPNLPHAAPGDDFWALPLSSYRRRDFANPGMWLVSAYSAFTTGFKRNRARDVLRPQTQYGPGELRRAIEALFAESETPCLCVASRNFGVPERIHHFLDVLCEIARERPIRFVGAADYVRMATG